jgi:hypothetical protein
MPRTLFVLALALFASACTHVRPWERGKLAHPSMTTLGEPSPALDHVYSVQEGAVGGAAEAAGGCGCN